MKETPKKEAAKKAAPRKVKSALEKLQDAVEAARQEGWEVAGTASRLNDGVTEGATL